MAEKQDQVFVCKFRGGGSDGLYRVAVGRVAALVEVTDEDTGAAELYEYAGEEAQTRAVCTFDNFARAMRREVKVEAYYQIYRPALPVAVAEAVQ